ncbi:MAG TPA: DUF2520 domain-containing protein [Gemmatimonadaceae bacterium]|nr:DUF2520 domain-containing protein [Gemmatimonadaceae bacterium]
MTERLFVVGAGRAGRGIARALGAAGVTVLGLHSRRDGMLDRWRISSGAWPPALAEATTILVTVRDGQLEDALTALTAAPLARAAVVLHASGSADPAALPALRAAGHPAGTFHPLVPLADEHRAAERLRGAWIGIDGDAPARAAAVTLAERLGAHALTIPAGAKARYHAAAVFASNFPTVLAALAARLLRDAGVDRDAALAVARSLVAASARNLGDGEPAQALTGPVARGDVVTVARHLAALAADPDALAAYRALSRVAATTLRDAHLPPDGLAAVEAVLRPGGSAP